MQQEQEVQEVQVEWVEWVEQVECQVCQVCQECQERELECQVQVSHDLEQSKYHKLKWKLSKD